jgi:dimethylamine corrinoid protein
MTDYEKLAEALGNLDEETVFGQVDQLLASSDFNAQAAVQACQQGLAIVGDRFKDGEYFVGDLIYSGDLMTDVFAKLKPYMVGSAAGGNLGRMVFCTVEGDLHDIGKNIVKCMLETAGFEVTDLGIDVPPAKVVQAVQETGARIVALSGVLTLAIDSMKRTVEALKAAGLRDKVKVIIGGAPVTADYCKLVGADAWSINAAESVAICRRWSEEMS